MYLFCTMVVGVDVYTALEKHSGRVPNQSHYHRFDNGQLVRIHIKEVTEDRAAKLRIKSEGFKDYGWILEDILKKAPEAG